jgi:two-component system KDP operon response regulator KdpE
MNKRILVVDDEAPIQRFLKPALAASGYDVLSAENGRQALHLIATAAPDLIVLDLGLPDMDGKEVLTQARQFSKVPVIVLSARDREAEKIAALDLGADDYVEKPFAIGEFMARLRAALRHAAKDEQANSHFEAGGLSVDLDRRRVERAGLAIKLTPKEFDLLAILVRHAGRVVTHKQILSQVWGVAHVEDTQYLRVFVGQLRAKIEADGSTRLIQTEAGVGYRLCGGDRC